MDARTQAKQLLQFKIQAKQVELARMVRGYIVEHGSPEFLMQKQAPLLPASALDRCQLFPDRLSLLHMLPRGGRVAELGTARGDFAWEILRRCEPDELHLFDLDLSRLRPDLAKLAQVHCHAGDSSTQLEKLEDASFDWIYIDGDHSYQGVTRDLAVARRKLKPSGTLVFNDYLHMSPLELVAYGVVPAVNELVCGQLEGGESWQVTGYALNSDGYHDIALQRRPELPGETDTA